MERRKEGNMATRISSDELLAYIFENVLPQYGMPFREKQEAFAFFYSTCVEV